MKAAMNEQTICFLLLAASGVIQACFGLLVKGIRGWRWEQMWLAQTLFSNLVFPLLWAALLPDAFWRTIASVPLSTWLGSYAWGALWGLGGVAYGLTLTRLGVFFANSLVFGITTLTGALLPFFFKVVPGPNRPGSFAAGLVVSIVAVVILGALRRGNDSPTMIKLPFGTPSYSWALFLAVFAGVFSAGYGLAVAFGFHAVSKLLQAGISAASAPLIVALPVNLGSATVAVAIALACGRRNGSMPLLFRAHPARNWGLSVLMGLCCTGGVFLYGVGTSAHGHPAPNAAFGIFMTLYILGGNAIGGLLGELRGRSPIGILFGTTGLLASAWLLNLR
jgi:L-rhamnose-H+ transport protein